MRVCEQCGEKMMSGYVVYNEMFDDISYYCSDECLYKNISEERYGELYQREHAYWTQWEEDDD